MTDLHDKAVKFCNHPTASKPAKAIIAELLAENEQLKVVTDAQNTVLMEAITRTNAAEDRFQALCEAEPVAWMRVNEKGKSTGVCDIWPERDAWLKGRDPVISLIPRPSMEAGK